MHEIRHITYLQQGHPPQTREDALALEEPLEIRVRGKAVSVTMRTPPPQPSAPNTALLSDAAQSSQPHTQDAELAAGFLLTEGMVTGHQDIARIDPCIRAPDGNVINVHLKPTVSFDHAKLQRNVYMSSSCGVCGKASIESVHCRFAPLPLFLAQKDAEPIAPEILLALPDRLRAAQPTFDQTGGLHAAGLFDATGQLIALREDVGRHNAVDKVIGHALLLGQLPLDRCILMVSGRASFEILQKSLAARIPIIAAVSAPSSLAAEFAQDSGQTLVGFLRPPRMNVYTHPQRIAATWQTDPAPLSP